MRRIAIRPTLRGSRRSSDGRRSPLRAQPRCGGRGSTPLRKCGATVLWRVRCRRAGATGKRHPAAHEPEADRAPSHVRSPGRSDRIEIEVDDTVELAYRELDGLRELLEVEPAIGD